MTSRKLLLYYIDVIGALDHVALNENRNAVFVCSIEMCFIFIYLFIYFCTNKRHIYATPKQLFCVIAL